MRTNADRFGARSLFGPAPADGVWSSTQELVTGRNAVRVSTLIGAAVRVRRVDLGISGGCDHLTGQHLLLGLAARLVAQAMPRLVESSSTSIQRRLNPEVIGKCRLVGSTFRGQLSPAPSGTQKESVSVGTNRFVVRSISAVPRHRRAWTAARNDVDDSHEDS